MYFRQSKFIFKKKDDRCKILEDLMIFLADGDCGFISYLNHIKAKIQMYFAQPSFCFFEWFGMNYSKLFYKFSGMAVYQRAVDAVEKPDKMAVFNIYLKKAAESYGVTMTRSIYEKAIEVLEDMEASDMCLRFSDMETKLGEIDRARAIYGHCSQMCDPR